MFEVGKEYKRSTDIHAKYGGQERSGIVTPKNYPVVFLFTSNKGEEHGYKDEYREDGLFWYTGEGQTGDMKMQGGNKAIYNHKVDGKILHLFEHSRPTYVRYVGEAECVGYHEELRPDSEGDQRFVFIFHLSFNPSPDNVSEVLTAVPGDIKQLRKKSLSELRAAALVKSSTNTPAIEKIQINRYRSEAIKLYVLTRASGKCEGCGEPAPFETKKGPYLECHHLYRLSDGGPDHPKNVVALCPNCHRKAHYAINNGEFNEKLSLKILEIDN